MKCKDIVKDLLIKSPKLRDDDMRLMANIWLQEIGGTAIAYQMNGYEMLSKIATGMVTSPESIRRCRQKIQELYPDLRGKSYYARHKAAETFAQKLKNIS